MVYLILKFDKKNRKKINKVLLQAKDVEPMYTRKAAERKVQILKMDARNSKVDRSVVEKELDELVKQYDKGNITLPDYCRKLNRLLAMTA